MEQELIESQKLSAVVDNVQQAITDVRAAFDLLIGAKKRLSQTLGEGSNYYHHLWKSTISDHDLERYKKESAAEIERNGWRYLIDLTGMENLMTAARQKELHEQIDSDACPTLTTENILGTLVGLSNRSQEFLEESVKEVFRWLRPQSGHYKTNSKWHVGKRVILSGVNSQGWRSGDRVYISAYRDRELANLGQVFSLLDGKGTARYPSDLLTQLNTWAPEHRTGDVFENDYFTFVFYQNGNAHIEFKRADLLAKLNQIGGGGDLPGDGK